MKQIVSLFLTAIIFANPLIARIGSEDMTENCVTIMERMVVDFPEAGWEYLVNCEDEDGERFVIWKHDLEGEDAQEMVLLQTVPWAIEDEISTIEELVADLSTSSSESTGSVPYGEMEVLDVEIMGNTATIAMKAGQELIIYYYIVTTPYAYHLLGYTYESKEPTPIDLERARYLLQDCCYLVY